MSSTTPPLAADRSFRSATTVSLVLALLGLALVVGVVQGKLLPRPDPAGLAPAAIWGVSLVILVCGVIRAVAEAMRFRREWHALDLLERSMSGREAHPRTLVGRHVAAVEEAVASQSVEREFRQTRRAVAAAELAGMGSLTRFGSSALLVLAVMGTFAGMWSALPQLTDAIGHAGSAAESGTGILIKAALDHVADAFGSNFVALFGSLVLGLLAFGASMERRALLTHLEHLSERWLYRDLPPEADASELQKAVNKLERSIEAVAGISQSIDQLGGDIRQMQGVLRETLSEMHSSFSDSVQRHGVRMQQQLNETVGELVATLGTTSAALQTTAVSYEGLVKGLEERDLGVRAAAEALGAQSARFVAVEERAGAAVEGAAKAAEGAAQILARVEGLAEGTLKRLADSTANLSAAVEAQDARFQRIGDNLAGLADQQRATVASINDSAAAVRGAVQHGLTALRTDLATHAEKTEAASLRMGGELAAGYQAGIELLDRRVSAVGGEIAQQHRESVATLVERISVAADTLTERTQEVGKAAGAGADRVAAAVATWGSQQSVMLEISTKGIQSSIAKERELVSAALQAHREAVVAALETVRNQLSANVTTAGERTVAVVDALRTAHLSREQGLQGTGNRLLEGVAEVRNEVGQLRRDLLGTVLNVRPPSRQTAGPGIPPVAMGPDDPTPRHIGAAPNGEKP